MYFFAICCLIALPSMGHSRTFAPSSPCFEESHCPDDFYCELAGSFCRQCLQCKDFKREAPISVTCVTAVAKCGPCLTGYVEKEECVAPDAWWEHLIMPYNWLISALVLVALIVCMAIVCVLRKLRVYTLRATAVSTKQSVSDMSLTPTAPAPPPPYNCVNSLPASDLHTLDGDAPALQTRPLLTRSITRETSEHQTATMVRPPVYEPDNNMPPRYESATRDTSSRLVHQESSNNLSNNSLNTSVEAIVPDCSISPKKLRVRQDSSDSDSGEPGGRNSGGRAIFANQNFSPLIITVIKNDSVIQQNKEISM